MANQEAWKDRWEPVDDATREGGQGETLVVKDRATGKTAVLKRLKNQKNAQARRRMSREVLNLRILGDAHCNVPRFIDGNTDRFEDTNAHLYFVMEHIPGQTLREFVVAQDGLSLDQSIEIARSLSGTIRAALVTTT